MTWPAKFDAPQQEGLVLVPTSPDALIQDLGPFLTGKKMETDLLPASALICAAEDGTPVTGEDGKIRFAFEGNANGAVNLERFFERCQTAASRLARRSPSIAYGEADAALLQPVARFDLLRFVFTGIIDKNALEAWSGESTDSYLPPADLPTPASDKSTLQALCALPMNCIVHGEQGVYAWMLMDGTILTMEGQSQDSLTAWRPGDAGLREILDRSGLDLAARMKFAP